MAANGNSPYKSDINTDPPPLNVIDTPSTSSVRLILPKSTVIQQTPSTSKSIESNNSGPSTSTGLNRLVVFKNNEPVFISNSQKLIPSTAIKQEYNNETFDTDIIPLDNTIKYNNTPLPLIKLRSNEALLEPIRRADVKDNLNLPRIYTPEGVVIPTVLSRSAPKGSVRYQTAVKVESSVQKRVVRKFCLISPHKRINESDPTHQQRIRYERVYNSPEEIPKLGRPHKATSIPKIVRHELNITKNRIERFVIMPAREMRLTEAETQTEESDFDMSGTFSKYPHLIKLSEQNMTSKESESKKRSLSENEADTPRQPVKKRPAILRSDIRTYSKTKPQKAVSCNTKTTDVTEVDKNIDEIVIVKVPEPSVTPIKVQENLVQEDLNETKNSDSNVVENIAKSPSIFESVETVPNMEETKGHDSDAVQNNQMDLSIVQNIQKNSNVVQINQTDSTMNKSIDLDQNEVQVSNINDNLAQNLHVDTNKQADSNMNQNLTSTTDESKIANNVQKDCNEVESPKLESTHISQKSTPLQKQEPVDTCQVPMEPAELVQNQPENHPLTEANHHEIKSNFVIFKDYEPKGSKVLELLNQHRAQPEPHAQFLDFTAPENRSTKKNEPITELDILKYKLNINDSIVEKARRDYENCLKRDFSGNLPLHNAVTTRNDTNIVRQAIVLKTCAKRIDIKNTSGVTPLLLALMYDCSKYVINKLIKLGSNLTVRDNKGNTGLHLAVIYSNAEVLGQLLPSSNSLVNELNDDGFSPLHIAVMEGKMAHIHFIVSVPTIDINLPDAKSGRTALFHAVECGYHDIARILVRRGGNKEAVNFAGQSLITLASESEKFKDIVTLLGKKRICKRKWHDLVTQANSENSRSND